MGFPKYDRLRQVSNIPPQKPARQKKKLQQKVVYPSVHYYGQDSGSGTETKAGLSDDVYCSSEDSFAAGFKHLKANSNTSYKNIELPYPDFLSDYDDNEMGAVGYSKKNDSEKSFDSDDEELSENRKY